MYEQLSLFDPKPVMEKVATSCWTGIEMIARAVESWMTNLVSDGEYVVDVDGHACVLRPTKLSVEKIPQGHAFYHYMIEGKVYSGIFVGR